MRIKTRILISTSTIVVLSVLTTIISVVFIINHGISTQTKLLLDNLHTQSEKRLVTGKNILENSIDARIAGLKHLMEDFCQSEISKRGILNGQWVSIDNRLRAITGREMIDFIVVYNNKGNVQTTWPQRVDTEYLRTYFIQSPLIKRFEKYLALNDLTGAAAEISFEKWGAEDKPVILIAGLIPNDYYDEPLGYVLAGIKSQRLNKYFENFFRSTGQSAILLFREIPLAWAGFQGSEDDITELVKSFNPSRLKGSMPDELIGNLIHNGEKYHIHFETASDFSAITTISMDDRYRIITGEPLSVILLAGENIKNQGLLVRKRVLGTALIITLIILILALTIVNIAGKRISVPLTRAARAAEKIASGDLTHTLTESGPDEAIILSKTMNMMTKNLKKHRDQLEYLVDKRTRELQESEQRFRSIFDFSPQVIALTEFETGKVVDINQKFSEFTNLTKGEVVGKSSAESGVYKDFQRGVILDVLKEKGEINGLEVDFKIDNGNSVIKTLMYAKNIRLSGKKYILTTLIDVTERWKAERALIENEKKYRSILEKSSIGYYEVDLAGNFTFVSDAMCDIFMLPKEELNGYNYKNYTDEETASRLFSVYNKMFLFDSPKKRFEYQIRVKDKTPRLIETSVALIRNEDNNKVVGFSGIAIDVTEQRNLEAQLQNVQKMEAVGTLAGGIAHDFNNILSAILGYAELAKMNSVENSKVQNYLDQLCLASGRAKELVHQILSFSRQDQVKKRPIDIGIVINEALKLLRASIPSTIEIVQNVKSSLGTVEADVTQIHQIVMNLCTNAFHSMKDEGGRLRVDLTPFEVSGADSSEWRNVKPGQYLKLTVSDTGHGIPSDIIARIFEPYFTTKGIGEGSGMGLAIVHGIVKNHDGEVCVSSDLGVGSTFRVLLPLFGTAAEIVEESSDSFSKGNEWLLFVDDETALAEIGKDFLEDLGYHVHAESDPLAALEHFKKEPDKFSIVISDMSMPKITGLSLAGQIREIREDIPVILCTGNRKSIRSADAVERGIKAILIKPLSMSKLSNTIREILDKSL